MVRDHSVADDRSSLRPESQLFKLAKLIDGLFIEVGVHKVAKPLNTGSAVGTDGR